MHTNCESSIRNQPLTAVSESKLHDSPTTSLSSSVEPLKKVNSTSGPSRAIMASIATSKGAPAKVWSFIAISYRWCAWGIGRRTGGIEG